MTPSFKSLKVFLAFFFIHVNLEGEVNPHKFIDSQAQEMVSIIINNQDLFEEDPESILSAMNSMSRKQVLVVRT